MENGRVSRARDLSIPPEPAAHGKFVLVHKLLLGVLLFPWRSDGPASVHATVNVLLFLFRWFQYLFCLSASNTRSGQVLVGSGTWNEHNKLSSTLIMAPALSNSPQ